MSVGIDETRQHDSSRRVDHLCRLIYQRFDLVARADLVNRPVPHEHRAVINDA
jgi:hypothetical protein